MKDESKRRYNKLWIDLLMGDKGAGVQLHQVLESMPDATVDQAKLYTIEKNYDMALQIMEEGYSSKVRGLEYLSVDPEFDPLREHPRFKKLIEKMNYPKLD